MNRSERRNLNKKLLSVGGDNLDPIYKELKERQVGLELIGELMEKNKITQADFICTQFLLKNPNSPEFNCAKSVIYKIDAKYEDAEKCIQKAIKASPENPIYWNELGGLMLCKRDLHRAQIAYEKAITLSPQTFSFHLDLAKFFLMTGDKEAAQKELKVCLSIESNNPHALVYLILLDNDPKFIEAAKKFVDDETVNSEVRANICANLGKLYEERKDYESAFKYFFLGNKIKSDTKCVDVDGYCYRNLQIARIITKRSFKRASIPTQETTPIFIVGMPRTGTSLLESILSAHEDIKGVGETVWIEEIIRENLAKFELVNVEGCNHDKILNSLAEEYLLKIEGLVGKPRFFIDKMPANYLYIGFIKLLFPNAKIIHMRRSPMDCCLSIFKNYFSGLEYSFNLEHIAKVYINYLQVMEHWEREVPGCYYTVDYERLATNPETVLTSLFEYIGLPFDGEGLGIQQHLCVTASYLQIRNKLNVNSIGLWHSYKDFLAPVIERFSKSSPALIK